MTVHHTIARFAAAWLLCVSTATAGAVSMADLVQAALDGQAAIIAAAIEKGFDPDQVDQDERRLLMYAAFNGRAETIDILLNAGADVNALDIGGNSALMFASTGPFLEAVTLLLDAGAEVNVVDSIEHFTPLMMAAAEGQVEIVNALLEKGADPTLKDKDGDTALSFAVQKGHDEVAEILKARAMATSPQRR